jgi:hypothetical protein
MEEPSGRKYRPHLLHTPLWVLDVLEHGVTFNAGDGTSGERQLLHIANKIYAWHVADI